MKCIKCHNTMDMETGEFSMNIDGKTVNVINAPIVRAHGATYLCLKRQNLH